MLPNHEADIDLAMAEDIKIEKSEDMTLPVHEVNAPPKSAASGAKKEEPDSEGEEEQAAPSGSQNPLADVDNVVQPVPAVPDGDIDVD